MFVFAMATMPRRVRFRTRFVRAAVCLRAEEPPCVHGDARGGKHVRARKRARCEGIPAAKGKLRSGRDELGAGNVSGASHLRHSNAQWRD